jgi:hypothetical protein
LKRGPSADSVRYLKRARGTRPIGHGIIIDAEGTRANRIEEIPLPRLAPKSRPRAPHSRNISKTHRTTWKSSIFGADDTAINAKSRLRNDKLSPP